MLKLKLFRCVCCTEGHCFSSQSLCDLCARQLGRSLYPRSLPPEDIFGLKLYSAGEYKSSLARFLKVAKAQPFQTLTQDFREPLEQIIGYWTDELRRLKVQGIAAVPSQPLRAQLQSDLGTYLGAELAVRLKVPFFSSLLIRPRFGNLSGKKFLSRADRWTALEMAVQADAVVRAQHLGRRHLLLVDDVCTTGASLHSCRRALQSVGFRVDAAFVLARAPLAGGANLG